MPDKESQSPCREHPCCRGMLLRNAVRRDLPAGPARRPPGGSAGLIAQRLLVTRDVGGGLSARQREFYSLAMGDVRETHVNNRRRCCQLPMGVGEFSSRGQKVLAGSAGVRRVEGRDLQVHGAVRADKYTRRKLVTASMSGVPGAAPVAVLPAPVRAAAQPFNCCGRAFRIPMLPSRHATLFPIAARSWKSSSLHPTFPCLSAERSPVTLTTTRDTG